MRHLFSILFFIFAISFYPIFTFAGADVIVRTNVKRLASGLPIYAETPASIACIYGLTKKVPGCPINGTTEVPTGGVKTIAVTEGGDDPNAWQELNTFSTQFGLPEMPLCSTGRHPCFQVAYATTGNVPPPTAPNKTDLSEHALDIEWAHAMAPQADIIMVEAASFDPPYIFDAVAMAADLVSAAGGGIVSNSWSNTEVSNEAALYDSYFQKPGVIFIASSGDWSKPARYPSSSPYVISAGGTRINRDSAGNFVSESAWRTASLPIGARFSGGSGGPSAYEPRPSYQNSVQKIVGTHRGTPDISALADPDTGVALFRINSDTGPEGEWGIGGGTSLAAPLLAGIISAANSGMTSTTEELTFIYNNAIKNYHSYWNDILVGNNGYPCLAGYDFATGLGTPQTYRGK